jgi:hypothetical protein
LITSILKYKRLAPAPRRFSTNKVFLYNIMHVIYKHINVQRTSEINAEELDSPVVSALGMRSRKLSNALNGQSWDGVTKTLSSQAPPCFGRHLSRWSRLHLQSLAPTNTHWARVVGYGPFSLWVIHKEGLCCAPAVGTLIG